MGKNRFNWAGSRVLSALGPPSVLIFSAILSTSIFLIYLAKPALNAICLLPIYPVLYERLDNGRYPIQLDYSRQQKSRLTKRLIY